MINKPIYDLRTFSGNKLDNNIRYINIFDEHLDRSYVTIAVKTGSFNNPNNIGGLAHFLEHMLFMGSKKYPNESHFYKRLNELGGSSNAYTDTMETVYYFNIYNSGLEEILDIFSRFFIDPLFNEDAVNREINSVDSEHKKNINNDAWRELQLSLFIADNNNTFMTGSLDTLNKPDIRKDMIEFYNKYYTPDNISICICSSIPIKEQTNIINKTFNHIKKNNSHISSQLVKPFYHSNLGKMFHLESIADIYELSYIWEVPIIPSQFNHFNDMEDFNLLNLIITNKSDKSLTFLLKNLGLITSMFCEIKSEGIFILKIKLTKLGLNFLNTIDNLLFQYIEQIYNLDLHKYALYFQKISNINFNCVEKFDVETLCNVLSVNHFYVNTNNVYDSIFLIKNIKKTEQYKNKFMKYINPKNVIKIINSRKYTNTINTKIMEHYNAKYSTIQKLIDSQSININNTTGWHSLNNEFLNIDIKLIKNLDSFRIPQLIHTREWFGGCSEYGEPIVFILMQLYNKYYNTPLNYLLTVLSCSIFNFLVKTILYKPLELCYNIGFDPHPSTSSINITIKGLNDNNKIKLLIDKLYEFLHNLHKYIVIISDSYIHNLIISLKRSFENTNFLNPSEYSSYIVRTKIYSTEYDKDILLENLNTISYDMIVNFMKGILNNTSLTTFVYGNIKKDRLFNKFKKLFKTKLDDLPKTNKIENIIIKHPNPNEKSKCVTYYYHVGEFSYKKYIILLLVANMLGTEFFEELRTKEQLGYLVNMSQINIRNQYYIVQRIQSEKSIDIIQSKIEQFNNSINDIIEKSNFNQFIETLYNIINEKDKSLDDRISRYLPEIIIREFIFNRNERLLQYIKKIKKEQLLTFVNKYLTSDNITKVIITS
jgi:insulysin